ncbi:MAG: pseudouridine synthase [Pseudomonadota bacterium]|nr:pseudouridine synthase [Pseudomonadota bacterium]
MAIQQPEDSLSKPPSRSAPRGTSAKQAPAPKGPKPKPERAERPIKRDAPPRDKLAPRPARKPDTVREDRAAQPRRSQRPAAPIHEDRVRPVREDRARPPREEKSSPSRIKRARVHREERSFTVANERPARARAERPAPAAPRAVTRDRLAPSGSRAPGRERAPAPRPQRPQRQVFAEPELPALHSVGAPQRIAKLLARAGVASRREIERMIVEGRIASEGVVIDTPATILTSLKDVTVDGKPVSAPSATRLFLYHKPAGLLTAANDPAGRPTIYDRLPHGLPRLVPVGRLDLNTEGLLLLTNDGEFKRQLELPSSGVVRSYRARVFGEVSQDQLEALIHGVEIEGMRYGSIDANLERRTGRNGWVEMRLTEGKNREVRRVLEYLGLKVSRLIRTSYGPFILGDSPPGMVDEVRQHDLVTFRKTLA